MARRPAGRYANGPKYATWANYGHTAMARRPAGRSDNGRNTRHAATARRPAGRYYDNNRTRDVAKTNMHAALVHVLRHAIRHATKIGNLNSEENRGMGQVFDLAER